MPAAPPQEHTNYTHFAKVDLEGQAVSLVPRLLELVAGSLFDRRGVPLINLKKPSPVDSGSPWDAPEPVLLNTWKHHAATLRQRIQEAIAAGPAGLDELARRMVVVGTELMDLYVGRLSPAEIAAQVLAALQADNRLAPGAYRAWVEEGGGYRILTLEDGSRWVLRLGETNRHVHIHPGRWSPQTRRVRANVLKTAVMVLAYVGVHGGDPMDLALVNHVRQQYLGLAPLGKDLAGDQGIGAVIDALQSTSDN